MGKSFLKKGLSMILAIALLIDALLGITLYMVVRIARNTAYEVVVKSNESMLERMDQTLTNLENVCYVMAYSSAVQSILTDKEVTFPLVDYHKPVRTSFAVAFACSPAIIGIGLYDNELTYLLSSGNNLFGVEPLPEDCYRISTPQYHVVEHDKAMALLLVYPIYRDSRVDSVIKVKIGYLAITIGDGLLKELVEQSDHVEDTLIAFTDQQGNMIYSNQPVEEDSFRHRMASGDSISSVIQHTGWQLHSIISNRSISDNMKPVVIIIGIIVALLLVLFFWLKHFFNKQIILPLNDLQQFMAKNSDIHQRLTPQSKPNNEMCMVMDVLNEMLDKIEKSSEEVLASQTRMLHEKTAQQQMEIIAYRNQVNPHFLYNTFDCIRGIAYMHNAMEIVVISQSLSSMFRYAVKGGNFVTIEEELQYMQSYATIIGYRFDGRITILDHIDPGLYQCMVIRMLLQPLVENAVLHGLEHVVGKGYVHVWAHENNNLLTIRIVDNGVGASPQKIAELNAQVEAMQHMEVSEAPNQSGVGITNIARRLFLHYGSDASLRFFTEESQGMAVEIRLTVIRKESSACIE